MLFSDPMLANVQILQNHPAPDVGWPALVPVAKPSPAHHFFAWPDVEPETGGWETGDCIGLAAALLRAMVDTDERGMR